MLITSNFHYRNFKISALISVFVAIVILLSSWLMGKDELFLLLNNDLGEMGDLIFNYGTHIGDGLLWIVWLMAILYTKRKHLLPLIISAFIFSTIFTQIGKLVIFPNAFRPAESIKLSTLHLLAEDDIKSINGKPAATFNDMYSQINTFKKGEIVEVVYLRENNLYHSKINIQKEINIHLVKGVDVHSYGSFPSGHTATIFTFALLIALLIPSLTLSVICVLIAGVIGYSRIYLSQHYPVDVAAGIIVAALSVSMSIYFQTYIDRKRKIKSAL